jgi:hypothetical protein
MGILPLRFLGRLNSERIYLAADYLPYHGEVLDVPASMQCVLKPFNSLFVSRVVEHSIIICRMVQISLSASILKKMVVYSCNCTYKRIYALVQTRVNVAHSHMYTHHAFILYIMHECKCVCLCEPFFFFTFSSRIFACLSVAWQCNNHFFFAQFVLL